MDGTGDAEDMPRILQGLPEVIRAVSPEQLLMRRGAPGDE
jgi:hypothetical protein